MVNKAYTIQRSEEIWLYMISVWIDPSTTEQVKWILKHLQDTGESKHMTNIINSMIVFGILWSELLVHTTLQGPDYFRYNKLSPICCEL